MSTPIRQHWFQRIQRAFTQGEDEPELYNVLRNLMENDPQFVSRLFYKFSSTSMEFAVHPRVLLETIVHDTNLAYARVQFDVDTGKMRRIRNSTTSTINDYINELADYDDYSAIEDDFINGTFVLCDSCGKWEESDSTNGHWADSDAVLCRICIDDDYVYSDYYEQYVHNDDYRTALDEDGNEVTIHRNDQSFSYSDDRDMWVHDSYQDPIIGGYHSSKGRFEFINSDWTKLEKRFFGVELEVECRNSQPQEVASSLNDLVNAGDVGTMCFFERDGSLSNGFEIITNPMGLDTHAKFWEWLKDKELTRPLLSHKTSTCGLHVHVSRRGLSKLQIAKMVTFINSPDNRELIEAVSRRYAASYSRIVEKKLGSAYKMNRERHEAVNLQPRETIEFRIFRGTLKYESLMSAIEFVNALVKYCHDQSGYGFDLRTDSFINFINKPTIVADTKHLRAYVDNRMNRD